METRNFSLVVYGVSVNDFDEYISKRISRIRHYIAIYHDKDNVEPHLHLCVNLKSAMSYDRVRKFFEVSGQNALAVATDTKYKSRFFVIAYFLHQNDADKYQYQECDLMSDDITWWQNDKLLDEVDKRRDLINNFLKYARGDDDALSRQDLYLKYGRDVLINFDKYLDYALSILHDFRKNTF